MELRHKPLVNFSEEAGLSRADMEDVPRIHYAPTVFD